MQGTSTRAHAAAPPPPGHAGLTAALPPSVRRSVIDGVSAESVDMAGIEAASAALSVQVCAALCLKAVTRAPVLRLFCVLCRNPPVTSAVFVQVREGPPCCRVMLRTGYAQNCLAGLENS